MYNVKGVWMMTGELILCYATLDQNPYSRQTPKYEPVHKKTKKWSWHNSFESFASKFNGMSNVHASFLTSISKIAHFMFFFVWIVEDGRSNSLCEGIQIWFAWIYLLLITFVYVLLFEKVARLFSVVLKMELWYLWRGCPEYFDLN